MEQQGKSPFIRDEKILYPLAINGAMRLVKKELEKRPINYDQIESDLIEDFETLDDIDLTSYRNHFVGVVLEIHIREVLEALMQEGKIEYETVGGLSTPNYTFDRPPRRNLLILDQQGDLITETDGDFKAQNPDGTYLVGFVEVKYASTYLGRKHLADFMSPERINDLGEVVADFSQEIDRKARGVGYIVAILPDANARHDPNSVQTRFENEYHGLIAVLPIDALELEERAESILNLLLIKRGFEPSYVRYSKEKDA